MAQTTQRRYQLTRVRAGDYIVPTNDGKTLLRISSYEETGDGEELVNGKWRKITGTYWSAHRYELTVEQMHARYGDDIPDDFLDWDRWEHVAGGFGTRAACIEDMVGS